MLYKNVLSHLLGLEVYWTVAEEYSQQVGEALAKIFACKPVSCAEKKQLTVTYVLNLELLSGCSTL